MELRLQIKQSIPLDKGGHFYYQGATVSTISKAYGDLPMSRRWVNWGNFIDITADAADDIFKTKLSWSAQRDSQGDVVPLATQVRKGTTTGILINGDGYKMLKQWLISDVSAVFNTVDVRLVHEEYGKTCGVYEDYIIKSSDLAYCDDELCQLEINLKQKDEAYNCLRSTLVSDNWQGWFQQVPANGKKHPRLSYCNEQRPNGIMVMLWYITNMVVVPTLTFLIPIFVGTNGIFAVINVVIGFIKLIGSFFGGTPPNEIDWSTIPYFDFEKIIDSIGAYFVESAGCGREFPMVLVRDYISNVCDKCGVKINAPIFFEQNITYYANSGTVEQVNDYYNVCYLNANVARGIRRFKSLNALRGLPNNTDYYQVENSVLKTLDMFLDEILPVWNHEWVVKDNTLHINRKDWFRAIDKPFALDLSTNGADRSFIIEGICYEWNEQKIPAFARGIYATDPADKAGNESSYQQNGEVSYGNAAEIPIFEGVQDKTTRIAAAGFRLDGSREDYIMDAFQIVINGGALTPFIPGFMFDVVKPAFEEYADYALLIENEQIGLPKLIIWDGQSYDNAKAARFLSAYPITGYAMPDINPQYNNNNDNWHGIHPPKTDVRGAGLTLPPSQPGYYLVTDLFGAREYKRPALLPNYNMYFAPQFKGSLWDRFHWIDDPNKKPPAIRNFSVKLKLCCDLLQRLQLFGNGNQIVLGEKIALPDNREGVITEINVSYEVSEETGMYIEIKGRMHG